MFEVVVLAGGRGQRLRPYTEIYPKPMLRLGDRPILEYVLKNIKRNGFNKVIIATAYKPNAIIDYFKDGSEWGLEIEYSIEEEPKNTAGALKLVVDKLNDDFLVVMGDHVTTADLRGLYEYHKLNKFIMTIGVKKVQQALEYGILDAQEGKMTTFQEKPIFTHYVNTGIYAMNKKIFNYVEEGEDIAKHLLPKLLEAKEVIGTYEFIGYWEDVGRVKDYERLKDVFSAVEAYIKLFKDE